MSSESAKPPENRWFQFGIRPLLVSTVVVAVGFGYWCNSATRLRRTVEALNSLKVEVYWDDEDGPELIHYSLMGMPRTDRLTGSLGPEYFRQPVSVVINRETPIDKILPHLKTLPSLKEIYVVEAEQCELRELDRIPGVEVFIIQRGRCGDVFIVPLVQLVDPQTQP